MPVSRWYSDLFDILKLMEGGENVLEELLLLPSDTRIVREKGKKNVKDHQAEDDEFMIDIPDVLPILPLRGIVVFPHTGLPLTIGQPRSIKLVDDIIGGDRLIGLVASKNPELETPGPDDLYKVGTVATVHRMFRTQDETMSLLVQGTHRFRVDEFVETEPYLKAKITLDPEVEEEDIEIEAMARNVRKQFENIASLISSIPQELVFSVLSLEDALQTVYTIANFQRMELKDAQELLELNSVAKKLRKLTNILTREVEVLELGQKIQNEARSEIEKVQRDYFLREQLKAIQKELGEQDEQAVEVEEFREKIASANMPEEAEKQSLNSL